MNTSKENDVICYTIVQKNDEETFEIQHSPNVAEDGFQFPIHEEYKLAIARSQFNSDTNEFVNKMLEDIRKSKKLKLQAIKKKKSVLKQSEMLLNQLKTRRKTFIDHLYNFSIETQNKINFLSEECSIIADETNDVHTEIEDALKSIDD